MKFLQLNFLPRSADVGLLVLRLWLGGAMALLHGWDKVVNFSTYRAQFMNFLGLGNTASLSLAIFGELVCPVLLVFGVFTRFAALASGITMAVAFWMAHGGRLKGEGSGEMAFIYLAGFVVLFVAGAGKYALDPKLGAKS